MPRKYIKQFPTPIVRKKIVAAATSNIRFYQFYDFLIKFCKEVKMLFVRQWGTKIKFRLSIVY